MPLFSIFIIVPFIEIALFIAVGDEIGIFATLLLCIVMAITGSMLVRRQGLKTLFAAKDAMERGELPVRELFDGICITVAGLMMITPGFFTDAIGLSLLSTRVRTWLRGWLAARFDLDVRETGRTAGTNDSYVIEAEYERLDRQD